MAAGDLLFKTPLNTSHPVNLVFGAEDVAPVQNLTVTWVSSIRRPVLAVSVGRVKVGVWASAMPRPVLSAVALYDNSVTRGAASTTNSVWQPSTEIGTGRQVAARDAIALSSVAKTAYSKTLPVYATLVSGYATDLPLARVRVVAWGECLTVPHARTAAHQSHEIVNRYRKSSWQTTTGIVSVKSAQWQDHIKTRSDKTNGWEETRAVSKRTEYSARSTAAVYNERRSPWQLTIHPQPGKELVIPVIPPQVCYTPPLGLAVHLLFEEAAYNDNNADLLFRCSFKDVVVPATKIVPIQKAYIVINDTHLFRADDATEIPVFNMSMSIDMDSWTWQFSADAHAQDIDKVMPSATGEPVKLRVVVNGNQYYVLAEDVSKDRIFASNKIKISGRGHSAVLDDPYSPILIFGNASARTAQQLMNDALTVNGVPIGWTVDWQLDDWLVPSGAWSHQGTYSSAINTIAKAAGGFVHPNGLTQTLHIKKRYRDLPWARNLATPDIQIPAAFAVSEGMTWQKKTPYNAIYVSGAEANGVLVNVVRTGSGGDTPATMIVDPLITHVDAARQRGITELANSGYMSEITLGLPVTADSGIILPGMLLEYVDGSPVRGVVKGVSINVGEKTVRQSFVVETRKE